ncbi:MAG: metal ABC transporter permease [Candidatus Kapabacteria bacterium]|nr:metal ABC transporter permease [Candidatus Kapabacteria bacterium]
MIEMFGYPFLQRALLAGILIGFAASYFGVFVVQRRISYIGSGLAHAAFGGVALGLLLGIEPLITAVPFTLFIAVLTVYLKEYTKISTDSIIGILYSVSVALGIIFLSLKDDYSADAYTYLFGSILTVTESDIWISVSLVIVTLITFKLYWGRWAYATFDRELAKADKLPVVADDYTLMIMTAITVVLAIKIVGIILITAYIVIPASFARLMTKRFIYMTYWSIGMGVVSSIAGLIISYQLDFPSGAVIIILQALLFLSAVFYSKIKNN